MERFKELLTNASMVKKEKSEKAILVGAAVRTARKRKGLVMQDIATHLGVEVAAVGNWETGKNLPSTENLLKTADFLGVDYAALSRGEVNFKESTESLNEAEIVTESAPLRMGPMDVRVLGGAVGGDDGDFFLNGEVAGYVRRPPGLAHVTNVFAIHILTDSMVPRYDPGELLYCGGRAPIPGDHVLIEMMPEDGEKNGKAYVKKLKRRTKAEIICEQYNPAKEIPFNAYALKDMWRIIPPNELFGF
jgi:phage repressor protein C with HTH and peptisase S24 domain